MITLLFFAYVLALYAGIGFCAAPLLRSFSVLNQAVHALNVGAALVAIFATVAYLWGMSSRSIAAILWIVAALGWLTWSAGRRDQILDALRSSLRKPAAACIIISTAAVLLTPPIVGGLQFTIFQGNHHDSINYLESAFAYSTEDYQSLLNRTPSDLELDGTFSYAQTNLHARPTVSIVYGVLSRAMPESFLGNHYAFLLAYVFAAFLNLARALKQLSQDDLSSWKAFLISSLFICGFWGQYIVDINSWSQIAWTPLSIAFFSEALHNKMGSQVTPAANSNTTEGPSLITLTLFFGCFYYYPEASLFTLPVAAYAWMQSLQQACFERRLKRSVIALGYMAVFFGLVFQSHVKFLLDQFRQASGSVDWWKYFQAFVAGRDGFGGSSAASVADAVCGLFGVYFMTPTSAMPPPYAAVLRAILLLPILVIFFFAATGIIRNFRRCAPIRLLAVSSAILSCGCLYFLLKGQFWTAGKAFSFSVPAFFALIVSGFFYTRIACTKAIRTIALVSAAAAISTQAAFAAMRITGSYSETGIHFAPPYPAIQSNELKTTFNYGDLGYLRKLTPDDYVALDVSNPWVLSVLRMSLAAHGVPYYQVQPIMANRYSVQQIGKQAPSKPITAIVSIENDSNQAFPSHVSVRKTTSNHNPHQ